MSNELSTEVKAQELHEKAAFWHNRAEFNLYKFLLEIKAIRDDRLYKELGYSTFEEYCNQEWNLSRQIVYNRIKTAERLSESDFVNYSLQFGERKTLFLTEMTDEQKEQSLNEGVPTEKGYKPYDEATQKEIGEYKRNSEEMERKAKEYEEQLKQQEQEKADMKSQLEQAKKSEEMAINQLEAEQDKDPEVIERYMEPDDYETIKRKSVDLEQQNKELQDKIDLLKKEPKQEEPKSVPSQKNGEPIDYREQINADSQALEPEVRKAMRREQLAGEVIATCEDLIDLYDDIDDAEAFDKYISTLNYKALGKAKSKIEKLMKVGGYK